MPTLRFNTDIPAAGGSVPNLLTGSKFEYLPGPATVIVYAVATVAGVDMECTAGNTVETDALEVPLQPLAGVGPSVQDDRIASFTAAAGDRLTIRLFNRAGGAGVDVRTLVEIRPL
jgi:hypothetical protein